MPQAIVHWPLRFRATVIALALVVPGYGTGVRTAMHAKHKFARSVVALFFTTNTLEAAHDP